MDEPERLVLFTQCSSGCWLVFAKEPSPELFSNVVCPSCGARSEIMWLEVGLADDHDIARGFATRKPVRFLDGTGTNGTMLKPTKPEDLN